MIQAFINIFRIPDLRNRVLFTLGIIAVYRIGFWIPLAGVDQQALVEIEIGEPLEDIEPLRIQALDLFEDCDRFGRETIGGEVIGYFFVELDRALQLADLTVKVADTIDDVGVVRESLEYLFVLFDRLIDVALLRVFLRGVERLIAVECQG